MAKYLDDKGLKTFTTKMKDYAEGKVNAVDKKVTSHIGNTSNPHGVTKEHVGLGNVTNDKQIPLSQKGATNGVATLGADGKLTSTQIPTTKTINGQSIFGSGNITVSTSLYEIVDALPTKNIDISKIYLVPATTTADKNNKTEYIYIGDPSKAYDATKWEKLGEEQKNATIETPGGSIVVDTAFDTSSSNPIANKTVALRLNTIEDTLNGKVAQEEYNTNKADVNSKLKALEDNTITVDTELKDSVHPVQNKAVNSAVQELNRNLNAKADDADLTTAKGRIETLESNSISKDDITLIPVTDGNGIASIVKENKKLVITQGKFVTSLVGYATTATMNAELAKKAEKEHTHSQYALTSALDKYALKSTLEDYALNSTLANYATQGWITEQKFAKTSAIPTKVSDLDNDSGFLTQHQSLADYATKAWVKQNAATQEWVKSQKYLTANDLQETIKITLVSTKSTSDAALRGAKITVKNGSSTIGTYTWQGSVISLKVASGLEVTVSVSDVTGYKTPAEQKFMTAMSNIREVKMEYKEQKLGIFILETDGTMTDPTNWTKSDNSTILGIYVGGENCVFVMALEGESLPWSTLLNTVVPGVKSEDGSESPTTDYDGIGNTKKFIDASPKDNTTSSAAYYCNNYKFKNGKNGYLFALGEALVVQKNFTKITQAYNAIGCSDTAVSLQEGYWTSNQDTRYRAWYGRTTGLDAGTSGRGDSYFVIPVCQY